MVVPGAGDLVGAVAGKHVDQVVDAEALAGAVDTAQGLLGGFGGVEGFRWMQAGVAVTAGLFQGFSKVVQQCLAAAMGDFAQPQHAFQALVFVALVLLVATALGEHLFELDGVFQPIGHPGRGRVAITAGTAGFLIVGLNALGQIQMRHKPHVRFVDAHAEGNGGDHDNAVLAQEALLVFFPHRARKPGVVGQGINALLA